MKPALKAAVEYYIYSSIHISIAAVCFSAEIFYILKIPVGRDFLIFVGLSTLLTYSLHRIIGVRKLSSENASRRFVIIEKMMPLILLIGSVSVVGLIYYIFRIPSSSYIHFAFTGAVCFLYVLPVMHSQKRLRDLPYVKIFFISIVWAYVACIPAFISSTNTDILLLLILFVEKLIFIFLITLPFDIRDLEIDRSMQVKTLAHKLGLKNSYSVISYCLALNLVCWVLIVTLIPLKLASILCLITMLLLVAICLHISKAQESDLYYSGLLDGVIIIRSLLVIIAFYEF